LIPSFGQKNLLKKSNSESEGATAETTTPLAGHLTSASNFGCSSKTAFPDEIIT